MSERDRERIADVARRRRARAESQEIGSIPQVADISRRLRAEKSLRVFCETYFPEKFHYPWAEPHLELISMAETCIESGGYLAVALPRGWGKTAICVAATEWAVLTGRAHYPVLIGATDDKAGKLIRNIKADLTQNELLGLDFPAAIYPIQCLLGETRRAAGQRYFGVPTGIRWLSETIVMPTIKGAPSSGAIIDAAGITGDIRGRHIVGPDGQIFRPDIALCDDVQTLESAYSAAQTASRLRVLRQDIAGLAGVGQAISLLLACTVICDGDLSDTVLDAEQSPGWRGVRAGMVKSWPTNNELWDEYATRWAKSIAAHGDCRDATAFYRANRAEMDDGAVVSWDHAYREDRGEISTIQTAMTLRLEDEDGYWAEYQNAPRRTAAAAGLQILSAKQIAARTGQDKVWVVPAGYDIITAGIDIQGDILFWEVAAWKRSDFSGAVLAYGVSPPQDRSYFTLRELTRTIEGEHPGSAYESALFAELVQLTQALATRGYRSADGIEFSLSLGLIDANWSRTTDIVHRVCRQTRGLWMPGHGTGIRAQDTPIGQYKQKAGERLGEEWIIRPNRKGRSPIRHVMYDGNYWKSFVYARLGAPTEDPSALVLYDDTPNAHRMFADHHVAEYAVRVEAKGRAADEWRLKPAKPDNHWFDNTVQCAVAASIQGALLKGADGQTKPRRVKASEIIARRRRGRS